MKHWFWRWALVLAFSAVAWLALSQEPHAPLSPPGARESDVKLPNGKSQRDEILKAEHEQNVKDAAELADLATQLKEEIEKNDRFVLSLSTLKKTDEIEKLAKKIRVRLRHD